MKGLYTFKNVFLRNKSSRIIYRWLFEFLVLLKQGCSIFNFSLRMPAGLFHPGTDMTLARAARRFLGGAHNCGLGNEKNSKKCGNVWALLRRRLGLEQNLPPEQLQSAALGAGQDEHGAVLCAKARWQLPR